MKFKSLVGIGLCSLFSLTTLAGSISNPPGITSLTGACSTASLSNMPAAVSSGGGLGLACADHLYNWDAARLPHLRYAISQTAAGVRDTRLMILGDSTDMGLGAGTGTNGFNGAHALNVTSQLAQILKVAGYPSKTESVAWTNPSGAGVTYNSYDPRVIIGVNWTLSNQFTVAGQLYNTSTPGSTITFAPTAAFDTFDIYYVNQTGGGFTVATEAGTVLTVAGSGFSFAKSTVTVPLGIHTLTLTATGTIVFIAPIIPYNSTSRGIEIINGGVSGAASTAFNITTNAWSTINSGALATWMPDAVIIELTINDANLNVPIATYITNISTIISAYQTAGIDVILASGSPFNASTNVNTPAEVAALYTMALKYNVPMIDLNARYVSYAYTNGIVPGFYFNALHFTSFGYMDKAQAYAAGLKQFLASTLAGPDASGSGAEQTITYQPGLMTAVNATIGVFNTFVKASIVDNIVGSAVTFSCVSNPTITLYECGTSTTCAAPTTIGTVTVTAAGTRFTGTVSSSAIAAGDSIGWAITAGTCASIDISGNAQVHVN